jgi:hypothetical protein
VEVHKVPEVVVCCLRLRNFIVRFWLYGMDEVGEFDSILNEEDLGIVSIIDGNYL